MELLQYWRIIRKRLHWILLFVFLAELGAGFYIQRQVPLYQTTTTLFISPSAIGAVLPYQASSGNVASLANTYMEYMRTRSFAQMVAAQLDVALSEEEILKALSVSYVRDTQIFKITATYPNPQVAQSLANTTAQMLIAANAARQRSQQQARLEAQRSPEAQAQKAQLTELVAVLNDEIHVYDEQIRSLQAEIARLQNEPSSLDLNQRLMELRQQLINARSERLSVLNSLSEVQTALANLNAEPTGDVDTAVIIDPAPFPAQPLPRNVAQPVVAALMAALTLGFGLAWFLEYLDYTVKTPEELDHIYGTATQGVIGQVGSNGRNGHGTHPLVTLEEPRSPIAEAFRALRTSIRMAGLDTPIRSLLITSAGPGEGKTFVAANLAVAMAQEGRQVILVDTDLRRPQLHTLFGLYREPGFTNLVLEPDLPLEQVLQETRVPNLRVLTCGTVPPNPSELLGSLRASEVMARLAQAAEMVLYDSPPAATVTDAVLVAAQVDAAIQVVLAGKTRIDLVRRCQMLLERAASRVLGPVLNRVDTSDLGYYANYYYYGGYYYEGSQDGPFRWWPWRRRAKADIPAQAPVDTPPANGTPAPARRRRSPLLRRRKPDASA
ncbi:MAG: hypothetical protein KatS3mg050_0935 [Litorilinea sp.]|nr:MAG: hypothetical protein KatS3mg050_0935 [Litorilinea sp.]